MGAAAATAAATQGVPIPIVLEQSPSKTGLVPPAPGAAELPAADCDQEHHWVDHPILCQMLKHWSLDPSAMANVLYQYAVENNLLVGQSWLSSSSSSLFEQQSPPQQRRLRRWEASHVQPTTKTLTRSQGQLPVVFAHGMGDTCFNAGMQHIVALTSQLLEGVYVVCIPTGSNAVEDTNNGYFLSMQDNVHVFAQAVANDSQLSNGFHAIGFSQGCNVIRGYIELYNTPFVHSFISINGVNAGEGAVPHCRPSDFQLEEHDDDEEFKDSSSRLTTQSVCELLMEQASHAAYTQFAQQHSFQANYWRDPRPNMFPKYQAMAQLAVWNQEATSDNPFQQHPSNPNGGSHNLDDNDNNNNNEYKTNWNKTSQFIWILATEDTMVLPREGEHWAAPNPQDPFGPVLTMNETMWYQQDLFGLRTAQESGKNHFETFVGDHLQFSQQDFSHWVQTYLRQSSPIVIP